ncbi:homeobox protein Nkx-6.1-like [Ischnura elegans]|uniref:homeobox protein Nkx-6.1-like n=1 Tax=Ischnura elegans TaxID=197161 RepID=UPI001ED87D16|nr:homeobox protein Nkx-6.1-like [Ischnura elegans]
MSAVSPRLCPQKRSLGANFLPPPSPTPPPPSSSSSSSSSSSTSPTTPLLPLLLRCACLDLRLSPLSSPSSSSESGEAAALLFGRCSVCATAAPPWCITGFAAASPGGGSIGAEVAMAATPGRSSAPVESSAPAGSDMAAAVPGASPVPAPPPPLPALEEGVGVRLCEGGSCTSATCCWTLDRRGEGGDGLMLGEGISEVKNTSR